MIAASGAGRPRAGLPALLLALGFWLLPPPAARAATPAHYLPPPGAPYDEQEVRVRTIGQYSLGGTLTTPRDGHRKHATVLLISGRALEDRDGATSGSDYRPFYDLADTLSSRGFDVLRLDDRGAGSSTGSIDSMDTYQRSLDTRSALEFLRARPDVDARKMALLGIDEGAVIAPMVARDDTALDALVLMASVSPGNYDALANARQVRVPVLILAGAADSLAPPGNAQALAAAFREAGNRSVTVRSFPGLGHDFLPAGAAAAGAPHLPPGVLGAIADWLDVRLVPAAEPKGVPGAPSHAAKHHVHHHRSR